MKPPRAPSPFTRSVTIDHDTARPSRIILPFFRVRRTSVTGRCGCSGFHRMSTYFVTWRSGSTFGPWCGHQSYMNSARLTRTPNSESGFVFPSPTLSVKAATARSRRFGNLADSAAASAAGISSLVRSVQ